jgi:predicted TIM-barrel fold metal-dependent hydrolase
MGTAPAGWDCHVHVFDAAWPVAAGHYRPAHRPLAAIEALAAAEGIGHLVLVQPSVYGTDNTLMLRALASSGGRHRGVVVVSADIGRAELAAMHAAGVRGARFNLVSPVGALARPNAKPPAPAALETLRVLESRVAELAPKLTPLGWHLQWYLQREQLPTVLALHRGLGLSCVLDHLGGITADTAADDPAWPALEALAGLGAWLKLSGWYRLGAEAPYTVLAPNIRRLADLFGERVLWGSDWPHTSLHEEAAPPYPALLAPVAATLGEAAARRIVSTAPALYA